MRRAEKWVIAGLLLLRVAVAARAQQDSGKVADDRGSPAATAVRESITVTADRGLVGVADEATSSTLLRAGQLAAAPGLTLDDRLHQAAGFQLFRRTSSWTANPTTEGISLRGLGSTAASRTLVVSDEVPLNDPFGGWIHWDEIPTLAIADVVLVRGGSADLYGSSAIGGVIDVVPVQPAAGGRLHVVADGQGATEATGGGDLLLSSALRQGAVLLAGSGLRTGGYVPTAPAARGAVDIPANVAEQSGRLELSRSLGKRASAGQTGTGDNAPASSPGVGQDGTVFLRGNVLNEARGNGTPIQTNATRLWRYAGGGDLQENTSHLELRVFGSREGYRQSFSAISADRSSEALTRLQSVPADEFGFSATGFRAVSAHAAAAFGLDLRDIHATDRETPVHGGVPGPTVSTSAHQQALGGYAEGMWAPGGWSLAGSVRVDSFRTLDGVQTTAGTPGGQPEPALSERIASPHLGVVRRLPGGVELTANGFRAFRGPTLNELYRTGQVGQQTTLPNPELQAERATGFEAGGEWHLRPGRGPAQGQLRATYFWTEVNRPVTAVLLQQSGSAQTLQRQNLGQIRSRGISVEADAGVWRGFSANAGYQLADATVTAFSTASAAQAGLLGKWIPEVPRQMVVGTLNFNQPGAIILHLIASYTGRAYDDAANQYVLHPYARFDVSAERAFGHGWSVFAGAQNLLNRAIDAGETPVLTLEAPRLVQAGLRWQTSR